MPRRLSAADDRGVGRATHRARASVAAVAAVALAALPGRVAEAQPAVVEPEAKIDAEADEIVRYDPVSDQQIVVRLGLAMGGRTTPGGLRVGGSYLYRATEVDWFEGSLDFTFGGGDESCFVDRTGDRLCDHGLVSGAALQLGLGGRRVFLGDDRFAPYARAGLGVRVISYGDDELRGVAVPLVAGGGVSARVHRNVAVGAEAALELGAGWFTDGVGLEPQLGLAVGAVVELVLE